VANAIQDMEPSSSPQEQTPLWSLLFEVGGQDFVDKYYDSLNKENVTPLMFAMNLIEPKDLRRDFNMSEVWSHQDS
jgi:hypothetical protein